jgi:hypothetical protein
MIRTLLLFVLGGCAPETPTVGACMEGEPSLTLGQTTSGGFTALTEGDLVRATDSRGEDATSPEASGDAYLSVAGDVVGLADDEAWSGVFRVRFADGPSRDALGAVVSTCGDNGPARVGLSVPLGVPVDDVNGLDGATFTLSATITDEGGRSADQSLNLVLDGQD